MGIHYDVFKNGAATVATCTMPGIESVSIGLWYRVGSRHEKAQEHGAAHFIEHMLFKGTRKRSAREISEVVEGRGGDMNAFTSEEMTCYYARMGEEYLPLLLDVIFDMTEHSSFRTLDVERERRVIQEEIRMYDDQPSVVATEELNQILWEGNSLGRPLAGTLDSIEHMSRKTLIDFWKKNYHPANMVLTVAGAVEKEGLNKMLAPYMEGKTRTRFQGNLVVPVRLPRSRKPRCAAVERPVQQLNLSIGMLAFSRLDPRRQALRLLSVLLGENMSSRLFQSLREHHGLAYSIHSSIAQFCDCGALYIQAGLEIQNLDSAIRLIRKELDRVRAGRISKKELARAKDYAIGQFKLNLESPTNQMIWMGESLVGLNAIPSSREWIDEIARVEVDEVVKVANEVIRPGRTMVSAVGDGVSPSALQKLSLSLV